jgi:hypothetical protein
MITALVDDRGVDLVGSAQFVAEGLAVDETGQPCERRIDGPDQAEADPDQGGAVTATPGGVGVGDGVGLTGGLVVHPDPNRKRMQFVTSAVGRIVRCGDRLDG